MPADPVARLEELEELLLALPGDPMLASTLDGFVAGLLVCPTLVLPDEWLPEVWGADPASDPAPVFETEQQAKDVTGLIMAHYNAVARALLAGHGRYEVVYDVDTRNDDTMWEIWIEGFARAMALRPSSWDSIKAADRGTRAALAGLQALIEIADGTTSRAKPEIDELTKMAPDLIPTWIDDLHAWRLALPSAISGKSIKPSSTKIGRNEACPCGSGRKYKKCCGASISMR
jgi:uncharacterized protein